MVLCALDAIDYIARGLSQADYQSQIFLLLLSFTFHKRELQ